MPTLVRLTAADHDAIVAVFCDAFRDYPVMRFVVGADHDDFDARLAHLIDLFVYRRVKQSGPLFGLMSDAGALVGAATMTLPNEPPMHEDVAPRAEATWAALGEDARQRYEQYAGAARTLAIDRPHHHLNMIGIARAHAGRGLVRPLLEAVAGLAIEDEASTGVTLTTEMPKNVAIYEHFGYRVTGHVRVATGLETWAMFRDGA